MPVDITIPSPGESVTEVRLGAWHKRSGEWVMKDEPLVEIESDKVTLEVPAPESGLLKIAAQSGADMKVGDRIGSIDPAAPKPPGASPDGATTGGAKAVEPAKPMADHPARSAAAVEQATSSAARAGDEGTRVTSVARRIAAEKGVDLAHLRGTGPAGRIRKADVLAASGTPAGASQPAAMAPQRTVVSIASAGERGIRREKMSKLRQRIAQRLVQAQHAAAMLTTFNECDMGEVMRLRSLHKEEFEKKHGVTLGFMSFYVKACVSALHAFPRVNAFIAPPGDEIEFHDYCDISIAVGTDRGLVVPVIRNAQSLSFAEIEASIKDLAVRAREGKLALEEMTGGTFTITNGGVYGSLNSTPILNPPQSGILGMHAIKKRPVEHPPGSGQVALRPMMYVALSYDHRLVDGAEAVSFLVHVKNMVENPERMMLGV